MFPGPLRDIDKLKLDLTNVSTLLRTTTLRSFITSGNPKSTFRLGKKIGQGSFGTVYTSTDKRDNKPVVIKVLPINAPEESIHREVLYHAVASAHPNVCKLYGVYEESGWLTWTSWRSKRIWLVMEPAGEQSIEEWLQRQQPPQNVIVNLWKQMVDTVTWLHSTHHIIHRDLKPENWIVSGGDGSVKLIDFGSCANAENGEVKEDAVIGSLAHMAPQSFSGSYTYASDMFSLAVITHQLKTGSAVSPFQFAEGSLGKLVGMGKPVSEAVLVVQEEVRQKAKEIADTTTIQAGDTWP
eukprot:PhF_6_TR31424/c0_g1_i3/m.46078/K08850/AURKX; aurora kinase, other